MKLIYTNDGAIGLDFEKECDVIWCNTQAEALAIMWAHFAPRESTTKWELAQDIAYAIDHMARTGDTIAEFGIFGSFMYTKSEVEHEF